LNQFNSHLVPCPSSFNGNWEEEVSAGKITRLVGSRLVGCGSWTACSVIIIIIIFLNPGTHFPGWIKKISINKNTAGMVPNPAGFQKNYK